MTEPPVSIGPSTLGGGDGLFVTRSFKEGDIILTIPSDKVVRTTNAWDDERLGGEFMHLTEYGGDGAKWLHWQPSWPRKFVNRLRGSLNLIRLHLLGCLLDGKSSLILGRGWTIIHFDGRMTKSIDCSKAL